MKDKYVVFLVGALFISVFIIGFIISKYSPIPEKGITGRVIGYEAIVTKVIDGDTVEIQDGQRARLLGINTPEKGQPYYQEATDRLKELVLKKKVFLEMDKSDKDKYDRLLRHIYVDNENVGLVLLREGYANIYFVSPDLKYKEDFESAEDYAKEHGLGIWTISDYRKCIGIPYFKYNAEGDDTYNLNGEYVKFSNSCDFAISMKGWTVKDEATHIYEFPDFVLTAHHTVTLYTGSGTNSVDALYWEESWPVWNNDGDMLYMWDSEGGFVLEYGY
jgi:micrococcal nuclease